MNLNYRNRLKNWTVKGKKLVKLFQKKLHLKKRITQQKDHAVL